MKSDKKFLNNIKAIIWDMDGVVVDSLDYHIKTEISTFKRFGINITPAISKKYDGLSISEYFKVISKDFKITIDIDDALKFHSETLANFKSAEVSLFESVVETLNELAEKYKLALATASPKLFKEAVLDKYNLKNYFLISLADEDVQKGKPDPEIYLKIAKSLNVQPEDCVVIEDSKNGIQAARLAGMKVIAHRSSHNDDYDLSLANFEVKSLREIPRILNNKLV